MTSRMLCAVLVALAALSACREQPGPAQPSKPFVQGAAPPPAQEALGGAPGDLGGTLPLKHGIFVASDIACSDPPNASLRRYDGRGLSGAHTRDCRINVLEKHDGVYEIDQSCIDAGAGPAPRSSERVTVVVRDAQTFTLERGRGAETFRYCAAALLPPAIRDWGG